MDAIIIAIAGCFFIFAVLAVAFLLDRWGRNRFRFNLKFLLLLFVIVGCSLFCAVRFILPAIFHRWAIHNIDQYGQVVFRHDVEQGGHVFSASDHSFSRWRDVEIVHVPSDAAAIDAVKQLQSLPEVKQVSLACVTDVGLSAVCELSHHPSLESLQLLESQVTDNGFSQLAKLQRLKSVFINTCSIGDVALQHLNSIRGLQSLGLVEEGPGANPARFSERGFAAIGELKQLTLLRLVRLQISDTAAGHLTVLKRLRNLQIIRCRISGDAIATIRHALPNCDIQVYEPIPSPPSAK